MSQSASPTTTQADTSLPLAILDYADIPRGQDGRIAMRHVTELAQQAERLGVHRFWLSEHHNMPGLACSVPELLIEHVASQTETIRVGAAGIMLPNHAPLRVAEIFNTLEMLHPGRIDLGLGRAPGTDPRTAAALRGRRLAGRQGVDEFPDQVAELFAFLNDSFPDGHAYRDVKATPVVQTRPEIFILGSSGYGAQFAAANGLATVFAHHMSPTLAVDALRGYRENFQPSPFGHKPKVIVSAFAFATHDPQTAQDFEAVWALTMYRLRTNQRGPRPTVEEARSFRQTPEYELVRSSLLLKVFAGEPERVAADLRSLAAAAFADEVCLVMPFPDWQARLESLELLVPHLS